MRLLGFTRLRTRRAVYLTAYVEIPVDLVTEMYPDFVYTKYIHYCLN